MAICHIQPVFLLLASLFFLPALRAVSFEYCEENGSDIGTVTRVEVSLKPEAGELSIELFGSAKELIDDGVIEVYAQSGKITDLLKQVDICKTVDLCPILPGSPFVLPLDNIPNYQLEGDSKQEYEVKISQKSAVKLCIKFSLPTSVLRMVSA